MINKFAKRLRIRRLQLNLTKLQVAQICEISPSNMTHYEQGKRQPTISVFYKLCKGLESDANWLLGLYNYMNRAN